MSDRLGLVLFSSGKSGLRCVLAATVASLALVPAAAHAQDSEGDEIVVTARSSRETLRDVPVAVQVFTQETLARYNSTDLVKIAQLSPQLEVYGGSEGSGGSFLVRGLGTTGDNVGLEQSVALNLDGVMVTRPRMLFNGLFDVRQVNVLAGPQALFFGKNSPAGVIQVESADPTQELSGFVNVGYEFRARERYVQGAISVPVTETLGVRFAGRYNKMRGWTENLGRAQPDAFNPAVLLPGAAHRFTNPETLAGRVTVVFKPTSDFTSNLKVTLSRYEDDDPNGNTVPICAPGQVAPTTLGATDGQSVCGLSRTIHTSALPTAYAQDPVIVGRWRSGVPFTYITTDVVSWRNSLDLGDLHFNATTGYTRLNRDGRAAFTAMVSSAFQGGTSERYRGFSQELRVSSSFAGPLNFALGGYFDDTRNRINGELRIVDLGPDPVNGSNQTAANRGVLNTQTVSAFGQLQYKITPDLELSGGVRWTHETKDAVQSNVYVQPLAVSLLGFLPSTAILSSRLANTDWSPEATLTYHPDSRSTIYAAYKTGYKSGGIAIPQVLTTVNTAANVVFNPEKTRGFEVGYKAGLFNGALDVELTAYYYKIHNLQLASFNSETASIILQNAATAKQRGVEFSLKYEATPGLTLRASGNYNRLNYEAFANSACYSAQTAAQGCIGGVQDLTGAVLARAPKFSGSAGFTYKQLLAQDWTLSLSADGRYRSSYFGSDNHNPSSYQGGFLLLNAGARLQHGSWTFGLIGRNLTNKNYFSFTQDKPGGGLGEIAANNARGAEIALDIDYRF